LFGVCLGLQEMVETGGRVRLRSDGNAARHAAGEGPGAGRGVMGGCRRS